MKVRRATAQDIDDFSDMKRKPSVKAWAGVVNGRIVALGGLAFVGGRWIGFCDLDEDARQYKMTIARTAIRILDEAKAQGIRFIYAEADKDEVTARKWLKSLGFESLAANRRLYRWRA